MKNKPNHKPTNKRIWENVSYMKNKISGTNNVDKRRDGSNIYVISEPWWFNVGLCFTVGFAIRTFIFGDDFSQTTTSSWIIAAILVVIWSVVGSLYSSDIWRGFAFIMQDIYHRLARND